MLNFNRTQRMRPQKLGYQIVDTSPSQDIIEFLSQSVIDQQFVLPLSQRDITIEQRVHLGMKTGVWLTVVSEGRIIGCRLIKFDPESRVVTFSTLTIHPDFQRRGVGTALLQRSIALARERFAAETIRFDTWSSNQATRRLASKFGFRKIGDVADVVKRPEGVTSVEYELDLRSDETPSS
jgi:RimJ/RimL family protein N-acetyltransferase